MCGRIGYGTLILVLLLGACGGDARSPELQTAGQAESSTGSPALPEAGTATGNGTAPAADTSLEMEIDLPAALREIAALQTPENVDAEVFEELKAELARVLREQAAPERLVAAASDEEVFKPLDVHLRVDHSERRLRWLYELPGDYDQNGEVNAADLVPLAFRLGVKAPDPGGDFAFGSRERITDGKRDGEINISDVSPVGRNFGRHSDGFAVYGSEDLQDFPFDFSQLSMAPLATVDQQGIVVEAGRQGYFELELAGELRSFYWVR